MAENIAASGANLKIREGHRRWKLKKGVPISWVIVSFITVQLADFELKTGRFSPKP
jgi:hypothetical protein